MKLQKSIFIAGLICITFNSFAMETEYKGNCKTDINFDTCLDKELKIYDNKLNKLYRSDMEQFKNKDLKKAEIRWIKYKEADCKYVATQASTGFKYENVYRICLINKTKARIADLRRSVFIKGWYKC